MKITYLIASTFCCALALVGCGAPNSESAPTAETANVAQNTPTTTPTTTAVPAASSGKTYSNVRGQIVKIVQSTQVGEPVALEIDHEAVPDFMQAMRMTIPLQNADDAKMLKVGDKIRFAMVLGKGLEIANIEMLPAATKLNLASAKMDNMGAKP